MSPSCVDVLAKLVGSGQSRRRILKTLAGGALGSVAAAVGLGQAGATAKKRSVGNSCTSNSDCASDLCVEESRGRRICHCQVDRDCPRGDLCGGGGTLGLCGCDTICALHAACDGVCDDIVCVLTPDLSPVCTIETTAHCTACASATDCPSGQICALAYEVAAEATVVTISLVCPGLSASCINFVPAP